MLFFHRGALILTNRESFLFLSGGLGWDGPTPAQHFVHQGTGAEPTQCTSGERFVSCLFYSSFASLADSGADVIGIASCRSGLGAAVGGEQRFDTNFTSQLLSSCMSQEKDEQDRPRSQQKEGGTKECISSGC